VSEPGSSALADPSTQATAPSSQAEIIAGLLRIVSPSRLTLFLQCRLKFWFRHVARLPKPKTPALYVGGSVHSVLTAWNKARWRQQPLTLKQLHEEYVKAWAHAEEQVAWAVDEEDEKKTAWRLMETYFRESGIPDSVNLDAVEVPGEADCGPTGCRRWPAFSISCRRVGPRRKYGDRHRACRPGGQWAGASRSQFVIRFGAHPRLDAPLLNGSH
jgi:hypothetical protein